VLPAVDDRFADAHAAPLGDPALVQRYLPRLTAGLRRAAPGRDVHDRTGRRLRRGRHRHARGAEPGRDGYRLWGDKWFCSNPDADLAMVLARIDGAPAGLAGVSLFLLPRTLDDGTANAYRIVRLKDKLGTRSMASGEIRLEGARAYLVGDPGRGFQQMADMVNNSRLSNGMRAAGLMRRATTEALFIARTAWPSAGG
jgi:acyl-CoA dehydrogenase